MWDMTGIEAIVVVQLSFSATLIVSIMVATTAREALAFNSVLGD